MTDKKEEKANYTPSTQQLDLEERMADDYVSPKVIVQGEVPNQLQEDGFVNTDPIYRNYANEVDKPGHPEEGVYADLEDEMFGKDLAEKAREGKLTEEDIEKAKAEKAEAEATPPADDETESEDDKSEDDKSEDDKSEDDKSEDDKSEDDKKTETPASTPASATKSTSSTKSSGTK